MNIELGLLAEMDRVVREEARERRRAEARAKSRKMRRR